MASPALLTPDMLMRSHSSDACADTANPLNDKDNDGIHDSVLPVKADDDTASVASRLSMVSDLEEQELSLLPAAVMDALKWITNKCGKIFELTDELTSVSHAIVGAAISAMALRWTINAGLGLFQQIGPILFDSYSCTEVSQIMGELMKSGVVPTLMAALLFTSISRGMMDPNIGFTGGLSQLNFMIPALIMARDPELVTRYFSGRV